MAASNSATASHLEAADNQTLQVTAMTNSLVNPSVEAVGENGFSARLVRFIESECGAGIRVVNLATMKDGRRTDVWI
jgi:hypothetical protein